MSSAMNFQPPQVQKCLFFISLELGTKIIAVIFSLLFGYIAIDTTMKSIQHRNHTIVSDTFSDITFISFGVFAVVLLKGAIQANPLLMAPWILSNLGFLSFLVVALLISCVMITKAFLPFVLVMLVVLIIIIGYSIVVVYSTYFKLKMPPTQSWTS